MEGISSTFLAGLDLPEAVTILRYFGDPLV